MKSNKTPRTLSECSFEVGYPSAYVRTPESRFEAFLSVLLACAIGVGFGICYVVWWTA